ncbi:outer membrane beta-barrel protein [Helicobacter vulpis]|uniref:outer membrane beta-barrel protein n=1 Tax=Helicobacter vulpis TaxID=2316076 RepID=UPI000EAEAA5F|nr:outer membrane beta-barrel protein [Helicobacter vulpis]
MPFRFLKGGLVSVCVSLSSLLGYGGDIRDGFFVEGSVGAQSTSVATYGPNATPPPKPINTASLQANLNNHLKELVSTLQNLNTSAAQVGSTKDILQLSPLDISGVQQAQIKSLEAQIQTEIGQLKSILNANPSAPSAAHDQTILQDYQNILHALQGYGASIISEVSNYDTKLTQAQKAFEDLKNAIESKNSADQKAYDNAYSAYQQKKQEFTALRDKLTQTMSMCIGGASCNGVASSPIKGVEEITQLSDSILQDILGIAKNPNTNSIISLDQYYSAYRAGITGTCSPTTANMTTCFSSVDPNILNFSIEQLVKNYAWFFEEAREIDKILSTPGVFPGTVSAAANQLAGTYDNFSSIMGMTQTNYEQSIPTANQYFHAPSAPVITPLPTPPSLGFPYNNLAPQITTAGNDISALGSIRTSGSVVPSAVPLSRAINSMGAFKNIDWNANVGAGFQYFLGRHLGFDVQVSVGYGYVNSALFKQSPVFQSLHSFRWAVGGDVIWDLLVPRAQNGLFWGVFVGVYGAGDHYFLNVKNAPLDTAHTFSALLNMGVRFQFKRNIIKLGVQDPLSKQSVDMRADTTHFMIDNAFSNVDVYIAFARLFGL